VAVTLSSVAAACEGAHYEVALSGATSVLGKGTGIVALTAGVQTVPLVPPVDVSLVSRAVVVFTG